MTLSVDSLTPTKQNFTSDVKERASIYVPAIGKVTIVMLLRNLVRLVQNRPRKVEAEVAVNGTEDSSSKAESA